MSDCTILAAILLTSLNISILAGALLRARNADDALGALVIFAACVGAPAMAAVAYLLF